MSISKRGHNTINYRYKLYDIEKDEYHYFTECSKLTLFSGIKKGTAYNMMKHPQNTSKKWNKYKLYSILLPVFRTENITY